MMGRYAGSILPMQRGDADGERKQGAEAPSAGPEGRAGGVVRRVDELGRIVIPVEIRKRFGIRERDPLEISVQGDSAVLTRPIDRCVSAPRWTACSVPRAVDLRELLWRHFART